MYRIIVIPPLLSWGYKNILALRFPNIFAPEKCLNIYWGTLTKPRSVSELNSQFGFSKFLMCFNKLSCNFCRVFTARASINLSVYTVCFVRRKVFQLTKHLAPSKFSSDKNKSKQNWQETSCYNVIQTELYQCNLWNYCWSHISHEPDWSTSMSRTVPRNCFASSLMP